jgi:hypothetical protein
MHLVAGCVTEGSMVFCQLNILEHSMRFHGDYLKRCFLTHRVSLILLLTRLISEKKYISANRLFYTSNIGQKLQQLTVSGVVGSSEIEFIVNVALPDFGDLWTML